MILRLIACVVMAASAWAQMPAPFCSSYDTGSYCPCPPSLPQDAGCPNSFSPYGARLFAFEPSSVSADTLLLRVNELPPYTTVMFAQGTGTVAAGAATFGDGVRCVGGLVRRIAMVQASDAGVCSYPAPGQDSVSVRGQVPPSGGWRGYQAWYRDPLAFCTPATVNLTNALAVVWTP